MSITKLQEVYFFSNEGDRCFEFSTKYLRAWVDLLSKAPLIDKDRLERFCFYRHAQEIGPADGRYGLFIACWKRVCFTSRFVREGFFNIWTSLWLWPWLKKINIVVRKYWMFICILENMLIRRLLHAPTALFNICQWIHCNLDLVADAVPCSEKLLTQKFLGIKLLLHKISKFIFYYFIEK